MYKNKYIWRTLPLRGMWDILFHKLSATDGQILALQVFGSEEQSEFLTDFQCQDDQVTLVGNSRIKKFDRPNDITEWDLVLMRGVLQTGQLSLTKFVDLQREDIAYAVQFTKEGDV